MRDSNPEQHTIPVSDVRCCDWKNTASVSLHLGQVLFDLGSCPTESWSVKMLCKIERAYDSHNTAGRPEHRIVQDMKGYRLDPVLLISSTAHTFALCGLFTIAVAALAASMAGAGSPDHTRAAQFAADFTLDSIAT